jgi:hypothetical protein
MRGSKVTLSRLNIPYQSGIWLNHGESPVLRAISATTEGRPQTCVNEVAQFLNGRNRYISSVKLNNDSDI